MAEHATVIRVTHFLPAEGKRDDLIARLEAFAAEIRKMEGCFGIQICSVREMPDMIGTVARWANQAALDHFLATTQERRAGMRELTSEPPTVEHLLALR